MLNRYLVACGYQLVADGGHRQVRCPLPKVGWFEAIGFRPAKPVGGTISVAGIRLYKEGESAPLDVFFSLDDTYDEIAARVRPKPFGPGRHQLPFLSAEDIVLFKLSFNRDKDWVDIRRVVADGPDLDLTYVERILVAIRGPQMHPRVARLRAMVADADL